MKFYPALVQRGTWKERYGDHYVDIDEFLESACVIQGYDFYWVITSFGKFPMILPRKALHIIKWFKLFGIEITDKFGY